MGDVSLPVTKRLFANSGNECAFEGCRALLVRNDGVVVGRICHIKAARRNGPRFEADQPDEQRHGYDNLLLLCPAHHDVIDKGAPDLWSVEKLSELKAKHESSLPSRPDDERSCLQMLENLAAYEHGLLVGSIQAHTVQVAQGDIHNYSSLTAGETASTVDTDRETLNSIVALLGGDTRRFLRSHDFACAFMSSDRAPLKEFFYDYDGPEHEFLDPALEAERQALREEIGRFLSDLGLRTFMMQPDVYRVRQIHEIDPPRSGGEQAFVEKRQRREKELREDVRILNDAADKLASSLTGFVRAARRKLVEPASTPVPDR